ncbi:MAG: ATP-binding protein [Roseateles sp.]
MGAPALVLLGPRGTRWLFGLIVLSALALWIGETKLAIIAPSDRIAYPLLALAFAVLGLLSWRQPQRLRLWQRCGATAVALYFCATMLAFVLGGDAGPGLYAVASFAPWSLGALLLLFTAWRANQALQLSLTLLALVLLPPTLLRFSDQPPAWLVAGWPLIANLALCGLMFCLALWALSRQLAPLQQLAPQGDGLATASDLVRARMAELERSRAAAQAASRAKSDFLTSIGHEIRTPMSTVLGQTRLLLAGPLADEQRRQLQEVAQAGEMLVQLIDGLLDYADLDAGRLQLASEPLHLEQLLAGAFDAVCAAAQAKQLELLCDIASPALLGADGARYGDVARLTQLLAELLGNAVKFTPAGQVRLSAHLESDGTWRLRVRDSGVGMTSEQMARLFLPFVQAESGAARRYGGIGLGLAICRALAERMGGALHARSIPGRGSEFELRLPLAPAPWSAPSTAAQPRRIALVQAAHSAGHDSLLALLRALAPLAHIEVLACGSDALQGLAAAPDGSVAELLLVDWVLPDMDCGCLLEGCAALGLPRARRVVLLSALDTPAMRERAQRLGADALCAKPLLPHTLRHLLDLQRPLPMATAQPVQAGAGAPDAAELMSQLDRLLDDADSQALTLWERHGCTFINLLPAPQAKALASAMQRLDFDAAQAALRGHYNR